MLKQIYIGTSQYTGKTILGTFYNRNMLTHQMNDKMVMKKKKKETKKTGIASDFIQQEIIVFKASNSYPLKSLKRLKFFIENLMNLMNLEVIILKGMIS